LLTSKRVKQTSSGGEAKAGVGEFDNSPLLLKGCFYVSSKEGMKIALHPPLLHLCLHFVDRVGERKVVAPRKSICHPDFITNLVTYETVKETLKAGNVYRELLALNEYLLCFKT